MKKIAVILAGNGVFDGAEIHEAVLALLAIDKNGASYQAFAPDTLQYHVINHYTKKASDEVRNVLVESARLVRGQIQPLTDYNAADYDALILPGGFGVAKNLCTYAIDGVNMKVNPDVEKALKDTLKLKKPIGAMCIAPVVLTKVFGKISVTVGTDINTIKHIEELGGRNTLSNHGDVICDEENLIFTTPCYMLEGSISQIALDADNLVKMMLKKM